MQDVTLKEDYLEHKKGDTIPVTGRHAEILFRTGIAEKPKVSKGGEKEEKSSSNTKEDKSSKNTKDSK